MRLKVNIFLVFTLLFLMLGCRKQTQNRLLGKWERVMISTEQSLDYGHRNLISQQYDFRDFKYLYIVSTLSGQVSTGPGQSLDSLPTIQEDRRRYEIVKKKWINIINEKSGEIQEFEVNQLGDGILKMTHMDNGIVGNVYDFYRSEEN